MTLRGLVSMGKSGPPKSFGETGRVGLASFRTAACASGTLLRPACPPDARTRLCEAKHALDLIAGGANAIYDTAGALGDSERVWILAKLPDTIRVIGDDIADKYLLLSNRRMSPA